jgi:hypothetical protein
VPIRKTVTPQKVGQQLARAVAHESAVRRIWATAHRDTIELWLLTDPVDADTERRLYAAGTRLYDVFPEGNIRLHIVNPRMFDPLDLDSVIPKGTEEIVVRSA